MGLEQGLEHVADLVEVGIVEPPFAVLRREPGRRKQRVLVPQRQVE